MSGSLHVSDEHGWCKAGWCYRAILREIIVELRSACAPPELLQYLEDPDGVPQLVEHIHLPDLPQAWRHLFATAASTAYQRCRDHGFSVPMPAGFPETILGAFRLMIAEMRELYEQPTNDA
jgi:hypothetical protein